MASRKDELTEIVCTTIDGKRRRFPFSELRSKVQGDLGRGRRFELDGEIWTVVDRVYPFLLHDPKAHYLVGRKTREHPLSDEY